MRHLLAAVATIGCLVAPPQVAAQSAAELCREMFSNLTPGAWRSTISRAFGVRRE